MTLLAWWPFDDTGATFRDATNRGHDGSFNGLGSGDLTKGYTFSGRTGCYFHIMSSADSCPTVPGSTDFALPDSFTISAWLLFPSGRIGAYGHAGAYWNYPAVVSLGTNHDSGGDWLFYYTEPGVSQELGGTADIRIPMGKRGGYSNVVQGAVVYEGAWHKAAWDYDHVADVSRAYLDDALVSTISSVGGGVAATSSILRFGSNPNYGYNEKARVVVSDLKIEDRTYAPTTSVARPPLRQRQRILNRERTRQRIK